MDYEFEYNNEPFKLKKAKVFECLYEIGELTSLASIGEVFADNNFTKASRIFCILAKYCNKPQDPMEVTKRYLHEDGVIEIYNAVGGLIALLNPPESYHPPESEAGK